MPGGSCHEGEVNVSKNIDDTVQSTREAMDRIKKVRSGNDLACALDDLPLESAMKWGLECPSVDKVFTAWMREVCRDAVFVVDEYAANNNFELTIVYYDYDDGYWYVSGWVVGDENVRYKDMEVARESYLYLTSKNRHLWEIAREYGAIEEYLADIRQTAINICGIVGVRQACELMTSAAERAGYVVEDLGETSEENYYIGVITMVGKDGAEYEVGHGRPKICLSDIKK